MNVFEWLSTIYPTKQYLGKLPKWHTLRNIPLKGAYYRFVDDLQHEWTKVNPRFTIAKLTYNQLPKSWKYNQWTFVPPNS